MSLLCSNTSHRSPATQRFNRRYIDDQGRMLQVVRAHGLRLHGARSPLHVPLQRARWVWMTHPEVSATVETMVKPLCDNSDFYFKAFSHKARAVTPRSCAFVVTLRQHRNKLAAATAETGVRILADTKRAGKGSAREAFLGALGR
jgi:hypothetical protein